MPYLFRLARADGSHGRPNPELRRELDEAEPAERRTLLAGFVAGQIRLVMRLAPDGPVAPDVELTALGLDSLQSLELRRRLQEGLGVLLPAQHLLAHPTPAALVQDLDSRTAAREDRAEE
jgi:acyl carrier protein